jgi:hypothetical protein
MPTWCELDFLAVIECDNPRRKGLEFAASEEILTLFEIYMG